MMIKNFKKNRAFVILFAVTLSALLLSIALGISNIAFREVRFSTNARDTNDAFFAADTGIECAFINDKSTSNSFRGSGTGSIQCLGGNVTVNNTTSLLYDFKLAGLGSQNKGCAIVSVDKRASVYVITSKGYNNGGGGSAPNWTCNPTANAVERQIESRY